MIKLESEDITPFEGCDGEKLKAMAERAIAEIEKEENGAEFSPVIKVQKKYLNNISLILAKNIDPMDFGSIRIKENKRDEFAWVLVRFDEDGYFLMQKIRTLLKGF